MRITYVIPNLAGGKHFLQPPLDVLYSMSILKKERHEVSFIDNRVRQLSLDDLSASITQSEAIIINTAPYDFSQMFHFDYRLSYSAATARKIKATHPESVSILTGIHLNLNPEQMMNYTHADIGILGETENTTRLLIQTLAAKEDLEKVPNLVIKNNKTIKNTGKDLILSKPDLDAVPFPDYAAIDLNDYYGYELVGDKFIRSEGGAVMLGSRGCPYKCNFCHNFWGTTVRYRTPENVVEEMVLLEKEHDAKNIFFLDPNFTLNKHWANEITTGIKQKNLSIPWSVQTRFDLVDENILEAMADSGCNKIIYGLESYDDGLRRIMDKRIDSAAIDKAVYLTRKHGIIPFMFVMLGSPGETEKSLEHTIRYLEKERLPYIAIVYGPRLGTEFQRQYQTRSGKEMSWPDLLDLKGVMDNNLTSEYLAQVVRYLRKQNILVKEEYAMNSQEEALR